jgi:hypothetical protein
MNNIIEMEYLFYYKMCYWQGCIRFWCVIWIAESTNEDHFPLYLIVIHFNNVIHNEILQCKANAQ